MICDCDTAVQNLGLSSYIIFLKLRSTLHVLKFTLLKYTVQCFLV